MGEARRQAARRGGDQTCRLRDTHCSLPSPDSSPYHPPPFLPPIITLRPALQDPLLESHQPPARLTHRFSGSSLKCSGGRAEGEDLSDSPGLAWSWQGGAAAPVITSVFLALACAPSPYTGRLAGVLAPRRTV